MSAVATSNWTSLWDQVEAVSSHTQRGIEHLEKYGLFLKERAVIEEEYASKLRSLVKKNLGKKKDEDDLARSYTYVGCFFSILHELESLAGQHELIAEGLRKDIYPVISTKCVSLRSARKSYLNELSAIHGILNTSVENMTKFYKNYSKAFKDAEISQLKYDKAEKNMDLSRAELERAKNNSLQRTQICEDAKQSYAYALQAANQQQYQHYNQLLPQILERLRVMDEERISETMSFMSQSIEVETRVMSIIQRCYNEMNSAVSIIDPSKDSSTVVEQYKSGYAHPQPYPFEDLGSPSAIVSNDGLSSADTMRKSTKNGGTIRVNRKPSMNPFKSGNNHVKKDGTIDFSSYPPQQRCRRLQHEIENISKEIETYNHSCEGAVKMLQVYRDNPKLGNAGDVDAEITIYKRKIDSLSRMLSKYKTMLSEAQSELNTPISSLKSELPVRPPPPQTNFGTPPSSPQQCISNSFISNNRSSYSEESISSDGSTVLSHQQKALASQPARIAPVVEKSEVYEECDMLALGTCTALYRFDGGNEGTTAMEEGDEMLLMEKDEGDGWTRVRHVLTGGEGFVPTSYLNCKWYAAN